MRVLFTRTAWIDYLGWQDFDRDIADRINRLIGEIQRSPFTGIGKPEPLRGEYAGWWSRRISSDHRLIYRVVGTGGEQRVEIMSCRFHYSRRN
jgi:toxin YoeB